jgi:CubicO group peptidase (beta-lactamase class C family)
MTAGLKDTDCPAYADVVTAVRRGKVKTLAAYCDALAMVPLQSEPGTCYEYGLSIDFIGRICEVVSGKDLDKFMKEELLDPLGMKDTHFALPRRKLSRVALLYKCKATKKKSKRNCSMPYTPVPWDHPDSAPGIFSAAGGALSYKDAGMWSTARDYARFCQMLLDDGMSLDGTRILRASTVRKIWSDGLAPFADKRGRVGNWHVDDTQGPPWEGGSWDNCGWSLISTLLQLKGAFRKSGPPRKAYAMGIGGGGGVYWLVDAKRKLVAISFSQSFDGGRAENDGLGPPGNDCIDLAVAAVDEGSSGQSSAQRQK